jgi:hypothetical protein
MSSQLSNEQLVRILDAAQNETPDSHWPIVLCVPFIRSGEQAAVQLVAPADAPTITLDEVLGFTLLSIIRRIPQNRPPI